MRHCTTRRCLVQHFVLGKVRLFVDERAHIVKGELRYSIKTGRKWTRKTINMTGMNALFEDLNHEC